MNVALATARDQKKSAEDTANAEAELARQEQTVEALQQYYAGAGKIDDALRLLASRFASARQMLDQPRR